MEPAKPKKLWILAVILSLVIVVLAITTARENSVLKNICGMYKCVEVNKDGEIYAGSDDFWLNLWKEGNKGYGELCLGGDAMHVYWSLSGSNTLDLYTFMSINTTIMHEFENTIEGDAISLFYDDTGYTFVKENAEATSFDTNELPVYFDTNQKKVYTKEEAAQLGGYFILRGDDFYTLGTGWPFAASPSERSSCSAMPANAELPIVSAGAELVFFSDDRKDSVIVRKAFNQGYTLPVVLYKAQSEDYFYIEMRPSSVLIDGQETYDSLWNARTVDEQNEMIQFWNNTVNEFSKIVVESLNGVAPESSSDMIHIQDMMWVFDCPKEQSVTIGYSLGSSYYEATLPACVSYWTYDPSQDAYRLPTQITKNGYYTIDLSTLDAGTYIIDTGTWGMFSIE